MAWARELGIEIGSATQHSTEGNEHGVIEVMLAKELQRRNKSLRWVKKTLNVENNIRKGLDAGMESTGYVLKIQF